jgi:hypothetical protein
VKVEISKRARRASDRIEARWAKHADDPKVYARELLEGIGHLETVSNPGTPWPTEKRPRLRRLLLPKSKCHLYFEINEREQVVKLLSVWDGRRGRGPSL